MFCSQCGQNNKAENKFCSKCGFKLEDSSLQMLSEEMSADEPQVSQTLNSRKKFSNFVVVFVAIVAFAVVVLATWRFAGPKLASAVGEDGATPQVAKHNVGNSMANISNGGYCAISGEWIYCTIAGKLHKMRLDGKEKTKLTDENAMFINVYGDWVYYYDGGYYYEGGDIYRIKTDGTNKQLLVTVNEKGTDWEDLEVCRMLIVIDDIVYYDKGDRLYSMNLDGSGTKGITPKDTGEFYIIDDIIYYRQSLDTTSEIGDNDAELHKVGLDGKGDVKLLNSEQLISLIKEYSIYIFDMQFYKNYFYVPNSSSLFMPDFDCTPILYRIDENVKNVQNSIKPTSEYNEGGVSAFNVANDSIYYMDGSILYNIKLDGKGNRKIGNIGECYRIYVFGDLIIGVYFDYENQADEGIELLSYMIIKDDGTGFVKLN